MNHHDTAAHAPGAEQEPLHEHVDPAALRLFRDESGRLRLTIEADRSYLEAKVVRAFPLTDPDRYIGLLDGRDRLICLLPEPERLEPASLQAVEEDLRRRYFIPTIQRFREGKEEFGAVYCDVETDHGRRQFVARGLRDQMEELADGQLLMADVDGNRYRVADWRRLDARSRRVLERLV